MANKKKSKSKKRELWRKKHPGLTRKEFARLKRRRRLERKKR